MMKTVFATSVALALFTPASAREPEPVASPTPTAIVEKKICRSEAKTGSIMLSRKVCRTKTDWDQIDAANAKHTSAVLGARERGSMGPPSQ